MNAEFFDGTAYCRRAAKLPAISTIHLGESTMAKGQQRANKEAKKPKKDTSPPKPISSATSEPIRTVTTAVIPRGKLKNK
jgi:hypothetical protein